MIRRLIESQDPILWKWVGFSLSALSLGAAAAELVNPVVGNFWPLLWFGVVWYIVGCLGRLLDETYDEIEGRKRHPAGRENS